MVVKCTIYVQISIDVASSLIQLSITEYQKKIIQNWQLNNFTTIFPLFKGIREPIIMSAHNSVAHVLSAQIMSDKVVWGL